MKNTNGNAAEIPKWMWYSTACSYWTDNFDDLAGTEYGAIPCCPRCGAVGYQVDLDEWNEGMAHHDGEDPGYRDFIIELKTTCRGAGVSLSALWEDYKRHRNDKKDKE